MGVEVTLGAGVVSGPTSSSKSYKIKEGKIISCDKFGVTEAVLFQCASLAGAGPAYTWLPSPPFHSLLLRLEATRLGLARATRGGSVNSSAVLDSSHSR